MDVAGTIKDGLRTLRPIVRERFASADPVERQWATDFLGEWLEHKLAQPAISAASHDQPYLLQ